MNLFLSSRYIDVMKLINLHLWENHRTQTEPLLTFVQALSGCKFC